MANSACPAAPVALNHVVAVLQEGAYAIDLRQQSGIADLRPVGPMAVRRVAARRLGHSKRQGADLLGTPVVQTSSMGGLLDREMAPDPMSGRCLGKKRRPGQADILLLWAATMETAGHRVGIDGAARLPH